MIQPQKDVSPKTPTTDIPMQEMIRQGLETRSKYRVLFACESRQSLETITAKKVYSPPTK